MTRLVVQSNSDQDLVLGLIECVRAINRLVCVIEPGVPGIDRTDRRTGVRGYTGSEPLFRHVLGDWPTKLPPKQNPGKVPTQTASLLCSKRASRDLLVCAIAAPVSQCHLRSVPERSAGVSKKDHQAPIGFLTCCEIRCLHAQTCRRVKLGPRTPTPATDLLPYVPVGSFAIEGKDFQAPIGIGSHNGSSTQLYIGWVSQRSPGAPRTIGSDLP